MRIFSRKAYLLFEVIVTISIVSIGLVSVVRALSLSMNVVQATTNYRRAIGLVSEKYFDIEMSSYLLGLGQSPGEGSFENDEGYFWSYSIEPLGEFGLGHVNLDVSWDRGRQKGSLNIESYVNLGQ